MTEKRVIFESEEELRNILSEVYYEIYLKKSINTSKMDDAPRTMFLKDMSDAFKLLGYIRRNPVEEWDEIKDATFSIENIDGTTIESELKSYKYICEKRFKALKIADNTIAHLKNQIVELNKKVGEI